MAEPLAGHLARLPAGCGQPIRVQNWLRIPHGGVSRCQSLFGKVLSLELQARQPVRLTLLASALIIAVSRGGARIASAFPLWFLMGLQCYRLGVELFLHQLWREGLLPRMLTFAGANVDIYLGATALVAAWVSTKGRTGLKLAFAWNLLGLLALGNVVIRAVLTAPGPFNRIHAEVPDRMIGTFPFLLIPGFFVPLAVILHLLAMRAIHSRFTDRARSRDGAR